ncbi:uroporphyrinogen-III synthase [Candidatus Symbiobacter mobilis]|uniref:Uroporphyrinogen-III synthase n=1 Tax=Candidatus Symbiobacter mobilis CR TaxID=946483 RepID=U5N968_9BURK|nr:uroporphyrinogen-III synthase [Candidatus Symbiobacter mobilis]AGX87835.1 uroporphyrinogen-III synthase [Candidatus Symbiobacter mobilis CR]
MRVVVTQAPPRAQAWACSLTQAGHEVLLLPLLEVCALPDAAPLQHAWSALPGYDALVFVSPAAVSHFFAARPADACGEWGASGKPGVWVTGPGTRSAALQHGVTPDCIAAPTAAPYDSERLWQVVAPTVRPGMRVLIVRGMDDAQQRGNDMDSDSELHRKTDRAMSHDMGNGREWLAQRVRECAGQVEIVAAYRRCAPHWSPHERECAQTASRDGAVWLLGSAMAIDHLHALLPHTDWTASNAVVTHPRLADAARRLGFGNLHTSDADISSVCATLYAVRPF